MPFKKRAKITVTNEGDKNVRSFYYHIDYLKVDELPNDTAYFCAQYKQEFPQQAGRDYLILDAEGQGTGTEDYFLCAWGLEPCLFPFFGCTYMSGDADDLGVRYTLYRWHILDPIRFSKSLRFEIEHTGWMSADETESGKIEGHVGREDDIATVAFWY